MTADFVMFTFSCSAYRVVRVMMDHHLALSRAMSSAAETRNGTMLLMNQLNQSVPVPRPMILMVSFSLASFSYTTPLMIMATE